MKKTKSSFQTSDNLKLIQTNWAPEIPAKAVIALVHGHGEYADRYDWVAQKLTDKGIAIVGMDLRGHGNSEGPKGHTPSYDAFMDDVSRLIAETQKQFPGVPVFLYGHSMGGNIVTNFVLRNPGKVKGAVISSPWLRLPFSPPVVKEFLGKVMANILPGLTQSTGLDANAISRDAEVVKAYKNDPLIHSKISAKLYVSMVEAGEWALENASKMKIPVYLFHGTADRLTSSKATQELSSGIKMDHQIQIYEGGFHEMHNEPEKEEVIAGIISWIEGKI